MLDCSNKIKDMLLEPGLWSGVVKSKRNICKWSRTLTGSREVLSCAAGDQDHMNHSVVSDQVLKDTAPFVSSFNIASASTAFSLLFLLFIFFLTMVKLSDKIMVRMEYPAEPRVVKRRTSLLMVVNSKPWYSWQTELHMFEYGYYSNILTCSKFLI